MKAARMVGYKTFDFVDLDIPEVMDGQVLIKMQRLSICGSDLRTYDRPQPEEDYPLRLGAPCHECLGEVVESRTDRLSVGDRVIVLPTSTGGLVEYVAESPDQCIKIPGYGDISTWIMAQPVGTVMYSVQRVGSVLGKRVAVLGQGAIGLSFAQLFANGGARQVIVTDMLDNRLQMSKVMGATHTINASREDVVSSVIEITSGEMVDVAVEACGRPETAHQVFQVLRDQGTAALFGLPHDEDIFPFDFNAMMSKLPTVLVTIASRVGLSPSYIEKCVNLMDQGRLDLSHLVTHRMGFNEVQAAYDIYSEKKDNSIKVVMEL